MNKTLAIALLVTASQLNISNVLASPGDRPDETPLLNPISHWINYGSLTDEILNTQTKIATKKSDMASKIASESERYRKEILKLEEKKATAPSFGWPLITDSKSDYQEKINEKRAEQSASLSRIRNKYHKEINSLYTHLGNQLASPNSKSMEDKRSKLRPNTASRETYELYSAAKNFNQVVEKLRSHLSADRSNYSLAARTYNAEIQLAKLVIQMNQIFIDRIASKYRPNLLKNLEKIKQQKTATADLSSSYRNPETQKLEQMRSAITSALPELEKRKSWSEANIHHLQGIIKTLEVLKGNVEIAKNVSSAIGEISSSTTMLNISMPPPIDWDLKSSDFQVK